MSLATVGKQYLRKTFSSFIGGRNTISSPQDVGDNQSPSAQNVLVDEVPGSVVTRRGTRSLGTPGSNPIQTTLLFKKADGTEQVIVSDGSTIWKTVDGVTFTSIYTLASGSSNYVLEGCMVRDKLWMTNGLATQPVLTYDGTNVVELDGTSNKPEPAPAKYIFFAYDRVWLLNSAGLESSAQFSALADSSGTAIPPDDEDAWPAANVINVRQNDGDQLYGGLEYQGSVWLFKSESIYRLTGTDEFTFGYSPIFQGIGSRFSRTIKTVDGVLHFLGKNGVYRILGTPERISDIIQPDIDAMSIPQLRYPFHAWDASSEFDGGTHSGTSASVLDGKLTLDVDATDGGLYDNFASGNTSKWVITSGVWSVVSGAVRCGSSTGVMYAAMDRPIGVWKFDFRMSSPATAGTSPVTSAEIGRFYFIKDAATQDGYFLKFRWPNLSTSTNGTATLWKLVDGTETQLGSSFTFTVTSSNTFKITRTAAGLTTVYLNGVSKITSTDTDVTACTKVVIHGANVTSIGLAQYLSTFDNIYFPQYQSSGTWTSDIVDTESPVAKTLWSVFRAVDAANGQTISYKFGLDNSNPFDGSPTVSDTAITSGTKIPSAIGSTTRYLRYKVLLSTTDTFTSPQVDSIRQEWVVGGAPRNLPSAIGYRGRYWLAYSEVDSSYNNRILVLSKRNLIPDGQGGAWSYFTGQNVSHFLLWQDQLFAADSRGSGDDANWVGQLLQLDYGSHDIDGDGSQVAINSYWDTKEETFGESGVDKILHEVAVNFDRVGDYDLAFSYCSDRGTYTETSINMTGSAPTSQSVFVTEVFGRNFRLKVGTNEIDQPFQVNEIGIAAIPMKVGRSQYGL